MNPGVIKINMVHYKGSAVCTVPENQYMHNIHAYVQLLMFSKYKTYTRVQYYATLTQVPAQIHVPQVNVGCVAVAILHMSDSSDDSILKLKWRGRVKAFNYYSVHIMCMYVCTLCIGNCV